MEKQLKNANMTVDDLRAKVIEEATAKASLIRALGINVTDADVKDFFESRGPGAYDLPERAHVRQIFVWKTKEFSTELLPPETIAKKRQLMDDLLKRLKAGEDFATLAQQYTEDMPSKDRGGELEPFSKEEQNLAKRAFSMKPNEISDVIESQDGFHIIKLLDMIPPKKMEVADMAGRIRDFLINRKLKELGPPYLEKLRSEAKVEIVDAQMKAANDAAIAQAAADAKAAAAAEAEAMAAATQAATEPTTEPVMEATTQPATQP